AANLFIAFVDDTVAVVVDAVPANLALHAGHAVCFVGDAVAVVVEIVSAEVDAEALSVFRGSGPEGAVVPFLQALERRPEGREPRIGRGRIDGGDPDLVRLRSAGTDR